MRIIAGSLKGRIFSNRSDATHPMSEKMRGSIFNTLGDVKDLSFLDCYSGTGAIAFEAISRGAKSVVCVESNKTSNSNLLKNIKLLNLAKSIELHKTTVNSFVMNNPNLRFNVIVCDPPYNDFPMNVTDILSKLLISRGVLILSCPSNLEINTNFPNLVLVKDKSFADGRLVFFKQNI